ncbi:unnamed protein product [Gongylonema pulchrum]|uniref:Uncharacterized protein n=1 Tax=Gongylonema pulchrum TaxID=637853 RepID=A0A183D709_9BILA|nr:unnamed protein product [Gongylonema pulchrum]
MDAEVAELKANVNNLSQCLYALLKRIEQLEDTAISTTEHPNLSATKTANDAINSQLSIRTAQGDPENNPDPGVQVNMFKVYYIIWKQLKLNILNLET